MTEALPSFAWNKLPFFVWRASKGICKFFLWNAFIPIPVPFPPFILPGGLAVIVLAILTAIAFPHFTAHYSGQDVVTGLTSICDTPWL